MEIERAWAELEIKRKPSWLKKRIAMSDNAEAERTRAILESLNLNTVCREATCPNYTDCFSRGVATFMILGVNCTRNCAFCNIAHGVPESVDTDEAPRIGEAVARLGLEYVVVTSVTRDDLADGGASQFAAVTREIREQSPKTAIELLVPDFGSDFGGSEISLRCVADAAPDIISHNIETVAELYGAVRPESDYERSLSLIERIGTLNGVGHAIHSKSGFMVGFGESREQILTLMDDLRRVKCEFLTIGQYLAPSSAHHPVVEYVQPETFDEYAEAAYEKGFAYVASAPFVRSSYHADEAMKTFEK